MMPPSLMTLCSNAIKCRLLWDTRISALELLIFEETLSPPLQYVTIGYGVCTANQRKRKRCFEDLVCDAWMQLLIKDHHVFEEEHESCTYCTDFDLKNACKERYWNLHVQSCLNVAQQVASQPHFEGSLGEIKVPDFLMFKIGYKSGGRNSRADSFTVAYNCQRFGSYARFLRLQDVLLQAETSHLLRNCKLKRLEILGIKTIEQVEGVCNILSQNVETLTSLVLDHCQLSKESVNAICDSLFLKHTPTHNIKHFRVMTSRLLEAHSKFIPTGLESFLASTRCMCTAGFHDSKLQQNSAGAVFKALFRSSSNIAVLDISGNNISGFLDHFERDFQHLLPGTGRLESLRVLKLRGNNLQKYDAACLNYALLHMPKLEILDLSDNPIADDGIMDLMPFFTKMAERLTPFLDLSIENCKLTCHGVISLLQVLSSFIEPSASLRIGHNNLGSEVGVHLGKFICTGIKKLHINDIGINSVGFMDAQKQITGGVKLVHIDISENSGALEAAKFISKLIVSSPRFETIDACDSVLPNEAIHTIRSHLETELGKFNQHRVIYIRISGLKCYNLQI